MFRRIETGKVFTLSLTAALLLISTLVPIGLLFYFSLFETGSFSLDHYLRVFTDPGLSKALRNSVLLSLTVTLASVAIAVPLAWAVTRVRMPLKGLISVCVLGAYVIPSFIGVIPWMLLLGPRAGYLNVLARNLGLGGPLINIFSFTGVALVLTVHLYPYVYFSITAALRNVSSSYEEAARLSGASSWRAALQITLPMVGPAIFSGAALTFLQSMAAFGVPAAIGMPAGVHTLTTRIYDLFRFPPKFGLAAAAAVPIIGFTFLVVMLQRVLFRGRSYATLGGKASRPEQLQAGWLTPVFLGYGLLVSLVTIILPMGVLLWASLSKNWSEGFRVANMTLRHYLEVQTPGSPINILTAAKNSVVLSVSAATVAVLAGLVAAWVLERTQMRGKDLLAQLFMIGLTFPATALGVGLAIVYARPPMNMYGTLWILFVAYLAIKLPLGFVFGRNGIRQIHGTLEESARMVGASWLRTLSDIVLPLARPSMVAAWIMIFAAALRELPLSILLSSTGTETLAVGIYMFQVDGNLERAAALAVLIASVSVLSVLLVQWLTGRKSDGTMGI